MSPRSALACCGALVALLTACPKAPPATLEPPKPRSPEEVLQGEVQALTRRLQAVLKAQDEAVWRHWTEGAPLDLGATAEDEKAIYTLDNIARVDALRKITDDPLDARALDQLRVHLASEFLAREVAPETAAIARLQATLTFKVGEQEHPLRELERLLARERNALRRQEMWLNASKALAKLQPALAARQQKVHEVVQKLGYGSYLAFSSELRRADLPQLAKDAERVLEVTAPAFRKVIEQLAARELRLPTDSVRMRDLPRMFRSRDVDDLFPKEALVPRVRATLAGMGVDPEELEGLRLDTRELPTKNPRPLALALQVPDDVRVSVRPAAGLKVLSGFLHEMGHALHAVSTREQRFALAKLSPGATSEAWSVLFELLTEDPVWLEQQAGLKGERLDRYLAASAAWDLYLLRRTAAHVLYEFGLHGGTTQDPQALFRSVYERALLVPIEDADAARFMVEQEEFFESAATLEAQMLAHQLQAQLKARFGPAWWQQKDAGEWLRPLWAHGNALDAREVARQAGEPRLSPEPLLLRLTSTLRLPIAVPTEQREEDE